MVNKEKLAECEEMIMSVLWSADEDMTLDEVTEKVNIRFGKNWKIQTVATFLTRLKNKGYISIYRVGRYSHYHPEVKLDDYRRTVLQHVKEILLVESIDRMADFIKNM